MLEGLPKAAGVFHVVVDTRQGPTKAVLKFPGKLEVDGGRLPLCTFCHEPVSVLQGNEFQSKYDPKTKVLTVAHSGCLSKHLIFVRPSGKIARVVA